MVEEHLRKIRKEMLFKKILFEVYFVYKTVQNFLKENNTFIQLECVKSIKNAFIMFGGSSNCSFLPHVLLCSRYVVITVISRCDILLGLGIISFYSNTINV